MSENEIEKIIKKYGLDTLKDDFKTLEKKFDNLEKKYDNLEKKYDNLEKKFDDKIDNLRYEINNIKYQNNYKRVSMVPSTFDEAISSNSLFGDSREINSIYIE